MSWNLHPETALRPLFSLISAFSVEAEGVGLREGEILVRGGCCCTQ
jgi:hypothetical protein